MKKVHHAASLLPHTFHFILSVGLLIMQVRASSGLILR